ncbi:MAG: YraN family protein [Alphaproteobacteria bacterium]
MKAEKIKIYEQGLQAESRAALYLQMKGYRIIARRYKTPVGEIDLIARRGKTLAAIEVKTRRAQSDALESVTAKNQARVARALEYFLKHHTRYAGYTIRFDALIYSPPLGFQHLDNAWLTEA